VFAPTSRLVVVCRGDINQGKFKAMLKGNSDNDNNTFTRAGPLVKAVARGTVWKIFLYDRSIPKPVAPAGKEGREDDEGLMKKEIVELCSTAKASGYKASIGSREIRGEWSIWYKDAEAAILTAKKWKDKEWIKNDEKDPPRWWKIVAGKSGGGKTAENALRDGLTIRSSGEVFTIRTSLETKTLQQSLNTLIQAFMGGQRGGMAPPMPGAGGGAPGGAPPGGAPPGPGPGAPGGGPTPPPGKRSRFWVRRRRGLGQQTVL
jgi:hypothetical protein